MPFRVGEGAIGPYETVEVLHDHGARLSVALRGATMLAWQIPCAAGLFDVVDGYATPDELASQDGVRNGILAPFPNRVRDGRYTFRGMTHDLAPGGRDRLVYHGFLRELDLSLDGVTVGESAAQLRLSTQEIRPGRFPGYPFAIDVSVEYVVGPSSVEVIVTGRNVGESVAPYAAGWHPYFRLPHGVVDDWTLTIPATQAIQVDQALIPLAGEAAFVEVERQPELDRRAGRRIGAEVVDRSWSGLLPDDDGLSRTTLSDPEGDRLAVWQEGGLMHVFTGDTLARDRRRSVALEPVEAITDAFNRADVTILEPGESRAFRFGVEAQLVGR